MVGAPPPAGTRAADPDQNAVIMKMYWGDENARQAQALARIAAEAGTSAGNLAIAWCLLHPAVSSVILGVRTVPQLAENLKALEVKIMPDLAAAVEALFPLPQLVP